jgi:NRPS condensation-like uncharacterized protein
VSNAASDTALRIPARFPATVQDLFNYLGRLWHDGQIRCVVRFAGQVDAGRMAQAVRLTLDAEPVLGCRLVERPWRPYWQRRRDLDTLPLCPVIRGDDLDGQMWQFLSAPVDTLTGPLVHLRLFRGETDTLCLKLDHGGGDGAGAMQYLALLAATYRELSAGAGYRPPSHARGDRGQWQVIRHVGPLGVLASLRRLGFTRPAQRLPGYGTDASGRAIALRRVAAERLQAMRAYGRERQAKFNDLLVAATYRALFARVNPSPGEPCLLALPVDLRRYLPPGHPLPVANLSGGDTYDLAYEPGESFDHTLVRVVERSRRFKAAFPGLAGVTMQAVMFAPGFAAARSLIHRFMGRSMAEGHMGPFLSNVGIIDEQLIDFGEAAIADAFGLGLISFPPSLNVAASTFRGVLTLTSGYCPTAIAPEVVEGFLDDIIRELPDEPAASQERQPITAPLLVQVPP